MQIIDAHQHFWNIEQNYLPWLRDDPPIKFRYGDYSALKRNYLPADYLGDAEKFEVIGSVFIETEWDPADPRGEVDWVGETRKATGLPSVTVAQAWLDRPDAAEILEAYGRTPFVRGIRHKPKAAPGPEAIDVGAPGSMGDASWRAGFALLAPNGLSFDLQTPWWHMPEARRLADDFPDTQIIINHTGLPSDRSAEGLAGWKAAMRVAAGAPNVAVKISGIGLAGQRWSAAANRGIVLDVIDMFGTDRAMFASNFPVDSLVGSFETIMGGFSEITSDFPQADRNRLFRDNARRLYRIADSDLRSPA